jgi:hypothetical protein
MRILEILLHARSGKFTSFKKEGMCMSGLGVEYVFLCLGSLSHFQLQRLDFGEIVATMEISDCSKYKEIIYV